MNEKRHRDAICEDSVTDNMSVLKGLFNHASIAISLLVKRQQDSGAWAMCLVLLGPQNACVEALIFH